MAHCRELSAHRVPTSSRILSAPTGSEVLDVVSGIMLKMTTARAALLRGLVALVALTVCAWFGLGVRQAHDTAHAAAILTANQRLSASGRVQTASLLGAAAFLNPDSEVNLLRAERAADLGEHAQAQRISTAVAREEPMNAHAWEELAAQATSRTVYVQALVALTHLVPHVPGVK